MPFLYEKTFHPIKIRSLLFYLFYTVFNAICQLLLLHHFDMTDEHSNIPFPEEFKDLSDKENVECLNQVSSEI